MNSESRELNRLTVQSVVRSLNALQCFSVGMARGFDWQVDYRGKKLRDLTIEMMPVFEEDERMSAWFSEGDEIVLEDDAEARSDATRANHQIFLDRMGAGKEEEEGETGGAKTKRVEAGGRLPFLADLERPSGIMSPHADTLGIGDLEDIESVASEQST